MRQRRQELQAQQNMMAQAQQMSEVVRNMQSVNPLIANSGIQTMQGY